MDDFAPKPDIDSSAPASPDDSSNSQTATLTPDQAVAFGLENCKPGDTYTIKVQFTGDEQDGGKTVDVISTEPDNMDDSSDQPPADADPGLSVGPEIAGDGSDSPDEGDDAQSQAEEKMLGYKRKKKKGSAMPFSIDKLRS